jgi:hypothetical protein
MQNQDEQKQRLINVFTSLAQVLMQDFSSQQFVHTKDVEIAKQRKAIANHSHDQVVEALKTIKEHINE